MDRPLALIVDRDVASRGRIRRILEAHGVDARDASGGAEAGEALRSLPLRLLLVDAQDGEIDVDDLLGRARRMQPAPQVIAFHGDAGLARGAALLEGGAFDVLHKPLDEARLQATVRAALRCQSLLDEVRTLRSELQRREGYEGLVGRSRQIERLRERIGRLAATDGPVWFCGEVGSGKEHAARELHGLSRRARGRFEVLPCAGPEARTAAARLGIAPGGGRLPDGLLATLGGGTLYLEELPALPPELQSALGRALDAPLDVRVLASSTSEPRALVERGALDEQLGARLAGETVHLPPLRERPEDVPLLARHFVRTICAINQLPPLELDAAVLRALERQRWTDNVRGLRNALEQAVIVSSDGTLRVRDLPRELQESPAGGAVPERTFRDAKREVVEEFERTYLGALMARHVGNVTAAALQAGMLRSALQRLLRKYALKSSEFRRERLPAAPLASRPQPGR